jgi:lipopolysaccharide biosynthesis regulator YciM
LNWAARRNNEKVKRVVQIENDLETLQVALQVQQEQQDAKPETDGTLRIMDLKVQIAQHDKFFAETEATRCKEDRPPEQYEITPE